MRVVAGRKIFVPKETRSRPGQLPVEALRIERHVKDVTDVEEALLPFSLAEDLPILWKLNRFQR